MRRRCGFFWRSSAGEWRTEKCRARRARLFMQNARLQKNGRKRTEIMKKLMAQIAKFGVVGVICFFIDFGVYTVLNIVFRAASFDQICSWYYLISQFFSFIISMVVNYILSFKYVFKRRDDMSKRREFMIFFILSVIGLMINEIVLYIGMDFVYEKWTWLHNAMGTGLAETLFKCFATGVVMVYNFISRKICLEDHSENG